MPTRFWVVVIFFGGGYIGKDEKSNKNTLYFFVFFGVKSSNLLFVN
jgi:hypothetical protein